MAYGEGFNPTAYADQQINAAEQQRIWSEQNQNPAQMGISVSSGQTGPLGLSQQVVEGYGGTWGALDDGGDGYANTQLGKAQQALDVSKAGWGQHQDFAYGFVPGAIGDLTSLSNRVYGGAYRTDPRNFETNVPQQQYQLGQAPQWQGTGAANMYNTEYQNQEVGPGPAFQDYNIGQGPGQFQKGMAPELQRFHAGTTPTGNQFQRTEGAPTYTGFESGEPTGIQDFKRGANAQFTGANQGQFQFDMQRDPGYQHRLQEGMSAIEGSAAARGSLKSGQTLKDLTKFAQGEASQEMAAAYGRQRGQFESDRSFGASEAARRTGFDVGQQQFGQGLDFQAHQAGQQGRRADYQFGAGMDFQDHQAKQAAGMSNYWQGQDMDFRASEAAAGRGVQASQFDRNLGFQADQAYQGMGQDQFRQDQAMGFDINRAAADDAKAWTGMRAQRAGMINPYNQQAHQFGATTNMADRQFGAGLNQEGVRDYRNALMQEGLARNQFGLDRFQTQNQLGMQALNQFQGNQLAANQQNYGMYNQQAQQNLGAESMLGDRAERQLDTYRQGIVGASDAEAQGLLGLSDIYGQQAARKAQSKNNLISGLLGMGGAVAGSVLGPVGSAAGSKLATKLFG